MLKKFKERLIALYEQDDLTDQQFADKIGVKRNTMANYRTGKNDMNTERLYDLCIAFRQSADYMLGLSDDEMIPLTGLTDEQKHKLRTAAMKYHEANKLL